MSVYKASIKMYASKHNQVKEVKKLKNEYLKLKFT